MLDNPDQRFQLRHARTTVVSTYAVEGSSASFLQGGPGPAEDGD